MAGSRSWSPLSVLDRNWIGTLRPAAGEPSCKPKRVRPMSLKLCFHPLSSFCQKALTALYENDTPFEPVIVDLSNEESAAAFKKIWPIGHADALGRHAQECHEISGPADGAPLLRPRGQGGATLSQAHAEVGRLSQKSGSTLSISPCPVRPGAERRRRLPTGHRKETER